MTEELSASLGPADILINSIASVYSPQLFHNTPPEAVPSILLRQALGPIAILAAQVTAAHANEARRCDRERRLQTRQASDPEDDQPSSARRWPPS